jgi:peptidoglycan hydrolase-like protein with peptidoglycan-binding domain
MGLRRAVNLVLALLVAVGLGVCADAATVAQSSTAKKKTPAPSTSGKTRKASSRKGRKKERGQQAPTADRISEIQTALSKDGSYTGTPSGKWDESTVSAMRNFQTTHGLNPSGKLDAPTLQKLGLGSQTAGVAAPIVPPNATSKLVSANRQLSEQ